MKKSIFLLCALAFPTIGQANPVAVSEPSPKATYLVDIIVNKGEELVSYSSAMLEPMHYGQTATATFGGKTTKLKYSGAASVDQTNGETTRHQFVYVTEENRLIANIYLSDYCGEMTLDEAWPLSKAEYQVPSSKDDCVLTIKVVEK